MLSGAACGSKLRLITMLLSAHRFRLNSSLSPQIQALERSQAHGLSQPTDSGSRALSAGAHRFRLSSALSIRMQAFERSQAHKRSQPTDSGSGLCDCVASCCGATPQSSRPTLNIRYAEFLTCCPQYNWRLPTKPPPILRSYNYDRQRATG